MQITELYGRDVLRLAEAEREKLYRQAFLYWRERGFPYHHFHPAHMHTEFNRLEKYTKSRLLRTLRKPSNVGVALATSFHPQIWEARVRGKSPKQIFDDDASLQAAIQRAPQLWLNRKCWNPSCMRMLVGLHNRSRVSNFRPTVARVVTDVLTKDGQRVLDFCAGYGGRYLGIASLGREYWGIDASRQQVEGLRQMSDEMSQFAPTHAAFFHGEAEKLLHELETASFDMVFTSPPYFRLEKYDNTDQQCWSRYTTYHLWKEQFLETVVRESLRILRTGGYLVINIANYGGYQLEEDFIATCQKWSSHRILRWRMLMSTNPSYKKRMNAYVKSEPIFVVRR